jgi:3-hydroxyacyl-[acyl-carrier-protein] dehydratase
MIEHQDIKQHLRQRFPFLLVDRILHVDQEHAVGIKNISGTDPHMDGHVHDEPIMPGVILVEAMSQVGGVLMAHDPRYANVTAGYLAGLDKIKFKGFVRPGDQVVMTARKIAAIGTFARVALSAMVGEEEVVSGEVSYYLRS